MIKMNNKKGQEEMVGFVLIVIMLIAMGLVFMFMIRPKTIVTKDLQTENLLNSMLESTTEGKSVRGMIEDCAINIDCGKTMIEITARLNASLSSSGLVLNRTLNGYSFSATNTPLNISSGLSTLKGNSITALIPLQNSDVTLKFYY